MLHYSPLARIYNFIYDLEIDYVAMFFYMSCISNTKMYINILRRNGMALKHMLNTTEFLYSKFKDICFRNY